MKTIEEVAKEYALKEYGDCGQVGDDLQYYDMEYPFIDGVEFAEKWIDIEDELPETNKDEKGILYSDYILIKVKGYEHPFIGYYVSACDDEFFDFIFESVSKSIKQTNITHWRPIEYK